jgi:hypothetical protein
MNAMEEEAFRNVAADTMALGFIVEILLSRYFKSFPPEDRASLAASMKKTAREIGHLHGATKGNEALSELLADVVVRMQPMLDRYVARALERIERP